MKCSLRGAVSTDIKTQTITGILTITVVDTVIPQPNNSFEFRPLTTSSLLPRSRLEKGVLPQALLHINNFKQ